jgi:hypothetical protein
MRRQNPGDQRFKSTVLNELETAPTQVRDGSP